MGRADYNVSVSTNISRRTLLSTLAAGAAATAQNREWKPRLGVLGPYTPANLAFAHEAGFNNMILGSGPGGALDAAALDDAKIAGILSNPNPAINLSVVPAP